MRETREHVSVHRQQGKWQIYELLSCDNAWFRHRDPWISEAPFRHQCGVHRANYTDMQYFLIYMRTLYASFLRFTYMLTLYHKILYYHINLWSPKFKIYTLRYMQRILCINHAFILKSVPWSEWLLHCDRDRSIDLIWLLSSFYLDYFTTSLHNLNDSQRQMKNNRNPHQIAAYPKCIHVSISPIYIQTHQSHKRWH